jgi:hypothetical protein
LVAVATVSVEPVGISQDDRLMKTLGIDLAAQPRTTAAVLIRWEGLSAFVEHAATGCTDQKLRELGGQCSDPGDRVGLDCPLGWPRAFVDLVQPHLTTRVTRVWEPLEEVTLGLRYRRTDLAVREKVGRWPISVSTDKLGSTALRAARLMQFWERDRGEQLARDGSGWLVEVYPAAARLCWGLDPKARDVPELARQFCSLVLDAPTTELVSENEHVFDALIAALVARATHLQLTVGPASEEQEDALAEGWIHLPPVASRLSDLIET